MNMIGKIFVNRIYKVIDDKIILKNVVTKGYYIFCCQKYIFKITLEILNIFNNIRKELK